MCFSFHSGYSLNSESETFTAIKLLSSVPFIYPVNVGCKHGKVFGRQQSIVMGLECWKLPAEE
jgi:hypothetical protein